jgi:hypothetical protein
MHKKPIVPVESAHIDRLDKVLKTGADLGNHKNLAVCYITYTPLRWV